MRKFLLLTFSIIGGFSHSYSQTDIDGLFMDKHYFCSGLLYNYSEFDRYWEGGLNRDNLNMGKVSNTNLAYMGNYGISSRFNFIFSIPHVKTTTTAGNMQGLSGFQDLSLWLKYAFFKKQMGKFEVQGIALGGYSFPLSNYTPDFLPLSIGLQSRTTTSRIMLDIERDNWYLTTSASYMFRQNIFLDRNSYYAERMYYTNEVKMPDATLLDIRVGHRDENWIVDVAYDYFNTLGGFDIARNSMPFPSNDMEFHRLTFYAKYETPINGLSLLGNGFTTFAGRNIGQTRGFGLGLFYILNFKKAK